VRHRPTITSNPLSEFDFIAAPQNMHNAYNKRFPVHFTIGRSLYNNIRRAELVDFRQVQSENDRRRIIYRWLTIVPFNFRERLFCKLSKKYARKWQVFRFKEILRLIGSRYEFVRAKKWSWCSQRTFSELESGLVNA